VLLTFTGVRGRVGPRLEREVRERLAWGNRLKALNWHAWPCRRNGILMCQGTMKQAVLRWVQAGNCRRTNGPNVPPLSHSHSIESRAHACVMIPCLPL
jgi:hypothetical protein